MSNSNEKVRLSPEQMSTLADSLLIADGFYASAERVASSAGDHGLQQVARQRRSAVQELLGASQQVTRLTARLG